MPYRHSFFLIVLACLSVVFISAPKGQPLPATAPSPVYPLRPDPAARLALDRAAAAFDPVQVPWLQMTFWQHVSADPLAYEAEGTYRAGPGQRLRIELEVRCATVRRKAQIICDGQTVWERGEDGGDQRVVQRPLTPGKGPLATTGPELARLPGIAGPGAMLESLQREVTFTHQEAIRWRNRDVIVLTGACTQPGKGAWPAYRPRQCRLVLDAATHWPHRLEWWGPAPDVAGDVRLVQIELRQPVLHQPLPDSLFTVRLSDQASEGSTPAATKGSRSKPTGWSVVGWPD